MEQIYGDGYAAYFAGQPMVAPYHELSEEAVNWRIGWLSARRVEEIGERQISIFDEGWHAYTKGKDCPYPKDSFDASHWQDGYSSANEEEDTD